MSLNKTVSIELCDTGDNYPINYRISSRTTKGELSGWHLVEILDITFSQEMKFRYDMIDQFIDALMQIKEVIKEGDDDNL